MKSIMGQRDEEELKKLLETGLRMKPKEHHFGCDCMIEGKSMSRIGG